MSMVLLGRQDARSCVRLAKSRDETTVPVAALFDDAALRCVIHIDDAETLTISFGPLKVIQQRPDEVAAQWRALLQRLRRCLDVLAQVLDALRIADEAIAVPFIGEGGSVLGYEERRYVILAVQAHDQVGERLWVDLPAHCRVACPGTEVMISQPSSAVVVASPRTTERE